MGNFIHLGEILTLCLMALALGMDAFSACIGLGMKGLRLRHIAKISLLNGLFHLLMPLFGMMIGRYLSSFMGNLAITIGGILLILFGLNMIYSSLFYEKKDSWIATTGWGLIVFSIGVSIDAFSVGLSLGMFAVNTWVAILLFGAAGFLLTLLGLLLGRKASYWIGDNSEAIGGMILLAFGIKILI